MHEHPEHTQHTGRPEHSRERTARHDAVTILTFAGLAAVILVGIGTSPWTIGTVVMLAVVSVVDVVQHHRVTRSSARRPRWRVTITPLIRISRETTSPPGR
jgi:hypothetical protein